MAGVTDLRSALLLVGGSACSFKVLSAVIEKLLTPESARKKAWKWRNVSTSLVHSTLTGAWAASCFYVEPQIFADLISSHSLLAHSLVAVSTGYFIYDFWDMALNQPLRRCWDLLLHHSVVISCFGLAVSSRLYVGFAVMSLLVEINSVFLHARQLLLLSGRRNEAGAETPSPRPSPIYRLTSCLNLGTFLVFRACTLGWMCRWLTGQGGRLPPYVLMVGATGLSVISISNMVLLYRLLRADVFTHARNKR